MVAVTLGEESVLCLLQIVVSTGAQKIKMPSKVDSSSYDPR